MEKIERFARVLRGVSAIPRSWGRTTLVPSDCAQFCSAANVPERFFTGELDDYVE